MAGTAGQILGDRYRLVEQVAMGSMGEIWRGYDEVREREVAVKEISLAGIEDLDLLAGSHFPDELAAPIIGEARALARLDHRGIAATCDAVRRDGTPWIVMELIPGPSLAQVIAAQGPLGWQRAAAVGAGLAEALGYAHDAGVIHARLHPGNVLLAAGRTVVTDFALTDFIRRRLFAGHDQHVDSREMDRLRYMAPEQVLGEPVRTPVDLWALGAILHTAVEGCPPFPGTVPQLSIISRPIPAPGHAGPMATVLNSLMTRDPGQRPSASVAAELLRAVAPKATGSALRRRLLAATKKRGAAS